LGDGSTALFLFNWSWTPATATLANPAADVESGDAFGGGASIELGAWDVRVFKSN
jgi:beta-galactosidase